MQKLFRITVVLFWFYLFARFILNIEICMHTDLKLFSLTVINPLKHAENHLHKMNPWIFNHSLGTDSGPQKGRDVNARKDSKHQVDCIQVAQNSLSHLYLYLKRVFVWLFVSNRLTWTALLMAPIFFFTFKKDIFIIIKATLFPFMFPQILLPTPYIILILTRSSAFLQI